MKTFKSKVTQHRGNSRVWIEGANLSDHGFNYHDEYTVSFNAEGMDIAEIAIVKVVEGLRNDNPVRKVSGRKRKGQTDHMPIIDLCNKKMSEVLQGVEYVQINLDNGYISVVPFEEAALSDEERTALAA